MKAIAYKHYLLHWCHVLSVLIIFLFVILSTTSDATVFIIYSCVLFRIVYPPKFLLVPACINNDKGIWVLFERYYLYLKIKGTSLFCSKNIFLTETLWRDILKIGNNTTYCNMDLLYRKRLYALNAIGLSFWPLIFTHQSLHKNSHAIYIIII